MAGFICLSSKGDMSIVIIIAGIIAILVLSWLLYGELTKEAPKERSGSSSDHNEGITTILPAGVERFRHWAGDRQPITTERVGFTILWGIFLVSLVNHLFSHSGLTGTLIYFLVILPHEAGHFLCSPFGWFLSIAGGSIWQVLLFVLFGAAAILRKRQNEALGWWSISGHSLISLSTYIADASARSLTLIPIPDPSRHDWGNMLEYLGLLKYDWLIAYVAIVLGGAVVMSCAVAGLFFTWYNPEILFTSQTSGKEKAAG